MTPVTITLTDDEYQQVVTAAGRRATLHENAGRGNDWTFYRHFLGCASEFALAKYVNGSWTPFADEDSFRKIEHDVVGRQGYQVRATDQRFGNLLLTRHDKPDSVFVLARVKDWPGKRSPITLVGWITARDGMTADNKAAAHDCPDAEWKVSADDLNPMETLP